jgi:hypothetical protein
MKKYLLRILLFLSPVILCLVLIVVVDPYEFVNVFHFISDIDKSKVINRSDESAPRGNMLWRTIHFKRNPQKIMLIGDSQGKNLRTDMIKAYSGESVFNYCVAGASFESLFEMFWFASKQIKLEKVYFQVAFMNYNLNRSYNIFHFAKDYMDHPYKYFTTKEIYYDAFINIAYFLTHDAKLISDSYEFTPISEMNALAEYRLDLFFSNYVYPDSYFQELKKIKEYCSANNIDLKFIILPTYFEVDRYLEQQDLQKMKDRFKDDIKSLGYTYDLDVPGEIKSKRENFIDYFHPIHPIMDTLVRMIWEPKGN